MIVKYKCHTSSELLVLAMMRQKIDTMMTFTKVSKQVSSVTLVTNYFASLSPSFSYEQVFLAATHITTASVLQVLHFLELIPSKPLNGPLQNFNTRCVSVGNRKLQCTNRFFGY